MMDYSVSEFVEARAMRPFEIGEDIERIRDVGKHFIDGELYHLSVELQPISPVFYNKDHFAEAGIEDEPSSMEELKQISQELQDAGIAPFVMIGVDSGLRLVGLDHGDGDAAGGAGTCQAW